VKFPSEKLGLRFHPAQFPDTGNGIYTIRLLELTKVSMRTEKFGSELVLMAALD
jgi:hypothetical protein